MDSNAKCSEHLQADVVKDALSLSAFLDNLHRTAIATEREVCRPDRCFCLLLSSVNVLSLQELSPYSTGITVVVRMIGVYSIDFFNP